MTRVKFGVFAALVALLGVSECEDAITDLVSRDFSDPVVLEAAVRETFVQGAAGTVDAFERVLVALDQGSGDGVILTPNASTGGVDAAVDVDFNGDGTRESTINASFIGDIATGATLSIESIDAGGLPSLTASGATAIEETSPGNVYLSNMSGSGFVDPPGDMNARDVTLTGGNVAVDLVSGYPTGGFSATIQGEGDPLPMTVSYEPGPSGGFLTRFSGPGFDFTVP